MIKKTPTAVTALCLSCLLLCACGKETLLLTADDYKLDAETSTTSRGVAVGDDAEAFKAAYGDYQILEDASSDAASEHTSATKYQLLPVDEVPYDTVTTTILPTFFIDGLPVDTEQFCEINEIAQTDLLSYLTDESYLAGHRVIYRYLVFTWEDGIITGIRSESMDYNQDASYYEAN